MTRLRITVSCLMIIVAVIAVDFAVLVAMRLAGNRSLAGAMPVADVLAVLLATTVGRLRSRGEAPLSHVMFLLAGGMELIFFVYLVHLRPELLYEYVLNTVWRRQADIPWSTFSWVGSRSVCSILVPALFVGWAARGYRLKLTTCHRRSERGREPRLIGYKLMPG